jgi:hypothetical protein
MTAMSTAFPELDSREAHFFSKKIKEVLSYLKKKGRVRKDGTRMHDNTNNILCWLERAQGSQADSVGSSGSGSSGSIVGSDSLAAPVSEEPAVDFEPLSQVTVNSSVDSDVDSDETAEYSDEELKAVDLGSRLGASDFSEKALNLGPALPPRQPHYGSYWDHGRCTMVRIWPAASAGDCLEQLATMKLGDGGFLQACFGDEEPIDTVHANALLTPKPKKKAGKVRKRPAAAVLKRPAKASKGLAAQQLAVEEQLAPVQQEEQLAPVQQEEQLAPVQQEGQLVPAQQEIWPPASFYLSLTAQELKFQMPNQTWIKLGLYCEQSYIRMQSPGEVKWPYLVGVSEKKAAKNGKHHHAIVKNIWDQLKLMRELPTKAFCKALVLQLVAE